MKLKDTYNSIAHKWSQEHKNDDWWMQGTDHFISLLKPGSHIFDIGCGFGNVAKYLVDRGFRVLGIDFAEKQIEMARKVAPAAEFLVADFTEPLDVAADFDALFMQASLLHVARNKAAAVVQGLGDKLKPSGYFYIAVKGAQPGQPLEENKLEEKYNTSFERFFSYYTAEEIQKYLNDAGCAVVYTTKKVFGNTEWIQVIGQKQAHP